LIPDPSAFEDTFGGEPNQGDDPHYGVSSKEVKPQTQGVSRRGVVHDPAPNNEEVDQRAVRSKWLKDPDKRKAQMTKAMPVFIADYFGNETAIASAMSVTPAEVRAAIKVSPELVELQEIAENSVEALLLDRMTHLAMSTKSAAPVRWLLEHMFPEKYGKAMPKEAKGKGFSAPVEEVDDLKSVLKTEPQGAEEEK